MPFGPHSALNLRILWPAFSKIQRALREHREAEERELDAVRGSSSAEESAGDAKEARGGQHGKQGATGGNAVGGEEEKEKFSRSAAIEKWRGQDFSRSSNRSSGTLSSVWVSILPRIGSMSLFFEGK